MSRTAHEFSVPQGLNEMLQDFVVQCLVEKPEDLVSFAAEYFTALRTKKCQQEELAKKTRPVASEGIPNNNNTTTQDLTNGGKTMDATVSDDEDIAPPPPRMPGRRRRQAVAAETYDPSKEDVGHKTVVHPKSEQQRLTLKQVMGKILLFKACEPEQIHELLDAMFERKVQEEDIVIRQGDDGDNFYVVGNGTFDIFVNTGGDQQKKVHTFVDSGSFGELALLYNCPRNATIVAKTNGVLWALDQAVFRRIVVGAAARKRRSHEALLQGVPMLAELHEHERANLADALESVPFADGDCVIKQNDAADCMYFVEEGNIRIVLEKDGQVQELSMLKKGDYFGEMALVMKQPRSASVFAKGKAKCARLDVAAFERLLGPCMEIMKRDIEKYQTSNLSKAKGEHK